MDDSKCESCEFERQLFSITTSCAKEKKNPVFVDELVDAAVAQCPHNYLVTSCRETRDKISHNRAHPSRTRCMSSFVLVSSNIITVFG